MEAGYENCSEMRKLETLESRDCGDNKKRCSTMKNERTHCPDKCERNTADTQTDRDKLSFGISRILGNGDLDKFSSTEDVQPALHNCNDSFDSPKIIPVLPPFMPNFPLSGYEPGGSSGVIKVPAHRPATVMPIWTSYSLPWLDTRRDRFGSEYQF